MPEPVATTPATPPEQPAVLDPLAPRQPVPYSPESDVDHQLKQMISRRRKPPASSNADLVPSASAVEAPAPPPVPPEEEEPKPPAEGFNDAIAGVLKFKPAPKKKIEPKVDETPAETPAPATPVEPPKTIVAKKKAAAAPAPPDITQITTAATTAAVRALQGAPRQELPAAKPEEALKPEDRHEYEVAKTLSEINPKYKDAPRVILDHVKKSEAYADRWMTANPGKQFDPDADEHDEFYDTLDKPWSDHEFRTAEIEMAAERIAAKSNRNADTKIKQLEENSARLELNPIIERTVVSAVGHMAKELKVTATDWNKLAEEDPITAEAIGAAIGPIQPLIEAIVQIDDPKGRFPVDQKNPAHQAWLQLLTDKEAQFAGTEHEGKMFATRIAFSQMNDAQRSRHWYLTPDHLVSEVVQDAVAVATERVKTEKERQKKIALSLGYIPAPDNKPAPTKAAATNGATTPDQIVAAAATTKPVSPSVGSGAKIDSKGTTTPTGRAATLAAMGDILFRPGNNVP